MRFRRWHAKFGSVSAFAPEGKGSASANEWLQRHEQLEKLVGLNVMDALLYEFACVLAATRSKAMEEEAKPSA